MTALFLPNGVQLQRRKMAAVRTNVKKEISKSPRTNGGQWSHSKPERLQLGLKRAIQRERKIEICNFFSCGLAPINIKIYDKLPVI